MTIKNFEIKENQKGYDKVQLIYDDMNEIYIVKWKWTTMKQSHEAYYNNYDSALIKYKERKRFAIFCN